MEKTEEQKIREEIPEKRCNWFRSCSRQAAR